MVYIARGADGGLEKVRRFFESYDAFPAGAGHRLAIIIKGWADPAGLAEAWGLALAREALVLELPDDGFDFGAYFRAGDRLAEPWLLFLNTNSFIRRENWLALILKAARTPGLGAVSCSGNWGSTHVRSYPLSFWLAYLGPRRGLGVYLRNYREHGFFRPAAAPPFPNPHLRTNAFMVRRDIWDAFRARAPFPADKTACYALEHGPDSLSRFVESRGLALAVAGADGRLYGPRAFPQSGTFCSGDGRNLIIGDNQFDFFQALPPEERRNYEFYSWGRSLKP